MSKKPRQVYEKITTEHLDHTRDFQNNPGVGWSPVQTLLFNLVALQDVEVLCGDLKEVSALLADAERNLCERHGFSAVTISVSHERDGVDVILSGRRDETEEERKIRERDLRVKREKARNDAKKKTEEHIREEDPEYAEYLRLTAKYGTKNG